MDHDVKRAAEILSRLERTAYQQLIALHRVHARHPELAAEFRARLLMLGVKEEEVQGLEQLLDSLAHRPDLVGS